jgi:hypothetical protein
MATDEGELYEGYSDEKCMWCRNGKEHSQFQHRLQTDHEASMYARLTGKHKHYCWDWDGMAIDETCPEFDACLCFRK